MTALLIGIGCGVVLAIMVSVLMYGADGDH